MADWLLIRLARAPGAPASWLVADGAGRIVLPQREGPLSQAGELAGSHRVCVLVPAADVVIAEADVPVKSGTKVQQIVPFALEEQLAEDVESLHFAVGRRPPDAARTPVAVVSRASMDEWLAQLRDAGIVPLAVFAESEWLPLNPGQAVGLLDVDCAIVRPASRLPVTMPIDALAEALELLRPPADQLAADRTGSGLLLYTGAAEWHQHSQEVEAIRDRFDGIKVQLLTEGPLALLAQQLPLAMKSAIDLLQGPYAPATSLASSVKVWRAAAVLLAALIGLHAVGSAVELVALGRAEHRVNVAIERTFRAAMPGEHNAIDARSRMEQRLASLRGGGSASGLLAALVALHAAAGALELVELGRAEHRANVAIERTFRAAMPGEHNAVDARSRMEQRLASLRSGGSGSGLLAALDALARARAGTDGTDLQALTFRDGTLELEVSAPSPEALDRLSRNLRAIGWEAGLTAARTAGSHYEGRIQIKPGGVT